MTTQIFARFAMTAATTLAATSVLTASPEAAHAASVVSPNNQVTTEGTSVNNFPFNLQVLGVSSQRYQQVYDASDFASLSAPSLITQILFRPDAMSGSAFSSTLPKRMFEKLGTS